MGVPWPIPIRPVVNDHPLYPPRLEGVLATLSLKIMLAFIPAILLMLGLSLLHDFFWGEKMARSERPAKMWDWRRQKMIEVIGPRRQMMRSAT